MKKLLLLVLLLPLILPVQETRPVAGAVLGGLAGFALVVGAAVGIKHHRERKRGERPERHHRTHKSHTTVAA